MTDHGLSSKIPGIRVPQSRPGPAGGRRDLNRAEKASHLRDAAMALFLERGIEATTIDDITAAANVAKGSFYRYFQDKTALVTSLLQPVEERLHAVMATASRTLETAKTREDLNAAYAGMAAELSGLAFGHLDVVRLYLQEARLPGVGARAPVRRLAEVVGQQAVALTEQARAHGLLRPMDPRVSALAVVGAVERLLWSLLSGETQGDPMEMAQQLISLVLDGVRVRPL